MSARANHERPKLRYFFAVLGTQFVGDLECFMRQRAGVMLHTVVTKSMENLVSGGYAITSVIHVSSNHPFFCSAFVDILVDRWRRGEGSVKFSHYSKAWTRFHLPDLCGYGDWLFAYTVMDSKRHHGAVEVQLCVRFLPRPEFREPESIMGAIGAIRHLFIGDGR